MYRKVLNPPATQNLCQRYAHLRDFIKQIK